MKQLKEFLNYSFEVTDKIHLDVKTILFVFFLLLLTNVLLKLVKKIVNKRLVEEDQGKFKAIFFARFHQKF